MCISPIVMYSGTRNKTRAVFSGRLSRKVPCGTCVDCKKSRMQAWIFRLDKELERSFNPLFVTLTYNEESVPKVICSRYKPPFVNQYYEMNSLCKRDVQLFMKRLRKLHSKQSSDKLVYYMCGEYGTKTKRPHYHFILFNLKDVSLIQKAWKYGFDLTLPLQGGGISYVLKYMCKPNVKFGEYDTREKEFSLMSKGIGGNYLTDAMLSYHHSDISHCYITMRSGVKMPLPKYFKEKIYVDKEHRLAVTMYLQQRVNLARDRQIEVLLRDNYLWHSDDAENYIDFCKINSKFEPRLSEVL